jgi:hypothetical protein
LIAAPPVENKMAAAATSRRARVTRSMSHAP